MARGRDGALSGQRLLAVALHALGIRPVQRQAGHIRSYRGVSRRADGRVSHRWLSFVRSSRLGSSRRLRRQSDFALPSGKRPVSGTSDHPRNSVSGSPAAPAVAAADWLLLALPDLQGVDSDIALLSGVVEQVLPTLGWTPSAP
ncbi:Luciferase family protein [Nocardioides sp. PD653]|nr:Luciferase family protein [Nocardioides sp. PD653-B2]GAW53832.1 Luciferase family protein [Nocardioides sp. PD653]